jgi:tRNA(fMet)-specific endonuclease VapC
MLDTDTLIYLIKRRPDSVARRVGSLGADDQLCMSFVTYAELLEGAERSTRRDEVVRNLERLARQVPVLYTAGRSLCEHHAVQFNRLKVAGTPIGAKDLWIACHALAEGATLVTHNQREFSRVAGLKTETWVE